MLAARRTVRVPTSMFPLRMRDTAGTSAMDRDDVAIGSSKAKSAERTLEGWRDDGDAPSASLS